MFHPRLSLLLEQRLVIYRTNMRGALLLTQQACTKAGRLGRFQRLKSGDEPRTARSEVEEKRNVVASLNLS